MADEEKKIPKKRKQGDYKNWYPPTAEKIKRQKQEAVKVYRWLKKYYQKDLALIFMQFPNAENNLKMVEMQTKRQSKQKKDKE